MASISTTTATGEAIHANEQVQTDHGRRGPSGRIHAAGGADPGRAHRGNGRAAPAGQWLCNNRPNVTAVTALILARALGNSPDLWLSVQRSCDPLEALNSPRERFERATPFDTAA